MIYMFLWKFNEIHVVYLVITVVVNECCEIFFLCKDIADTFQSFRKARYHGASWKCGSSGPIQDAHVPKAFYQLQVASPRK